eukprot:c17173_g1_i1 orf=123-695(+)
MFLTRIIQGNASCLCRVINCQSLQRGTFSHFCSRSAADQPDSAERNRQAAIDDDDSDEDDWSYKGTSMESLMNSEEMREGIDQGGNQADASDEDYMKPQPRKERIRKCLAKLKRGPDGRFINVLEVTSDINMLIAAYQSLKAKSRPTYLIEDSDEDDSMEGINIQRFKKLQKRLRSGTYRFGTSNGPKKK